MIFTIQGFSQQRLVENNLDPIDAVLLRWFVDFYASGAMSMIANANGVCFGWVKYSRVIEELPCLGLKTSDSVSRRFRKLVDCGVLDHYHHTVGGSFSTYKPSRKMLSFVSSTPPDEKSEGPTSHPYPSGSKVGPPPDEKSEQKTNLPEYSSTKDRKNPQTPKGDSPNLFTELPTTEPTKTNKAEETAKQVLEYLNEKTNSRFRTFKGCGLLALIREGRTMEDFKAVIDFKVLEWAEDPKMSVYLTPQTLFRAGNFDKYLAMAEKAKASGGTGLALYRDPDQKALADALEGAFLSRIPSGFPNPGNERDAIGWLVSAIWKQWPQEAFKAGETLVTSFWGLTQTGSTFMRSQPFLPSRMRSLYLDVVKACEMAAPPAYDAHREAIMRDLEGVGG
ncbi:hypothetical protein [Tetrasphaera phage TJE1]|uniref:Phage conserved hypothetical protein C-terminal domain-containing protein n=1 Tax=Tetrasphaera phage TJE1 TaxID=981335 RepID=G4W992_9CAUD|nr:replication initiation protein [Tetrasphaera phage TJE1]ADX42580.1 hypothetical protein [Tetrasphaera phage TJE1]